LIPSGGGVILTFEGNNADVVLYDLKGSKVLQAPLYASGEVDLAAVPPGMYTVIVRTGNGAVHQERLVVVD
jgi:hypothetical protein